MEEGNVFEAEIGAELEAMLASTDALFLPADRLDENGRRIDADKTAREAATIQVSVLNGGPFPLEKVPVTVTLQGAGRKQTLRQSVSVEPGATGTVDVETPPLPEGFWQGLVKIELDDELPFDNQRHTALLSAPPMPVVLVDGDPREAAYLSDTYYLDAALRLAPPGPQSEISPFAPEVVRISNTDLLPELTNVRVVVLNQDPGQERGSELGKLTATATLVGDYRNIRSFIHQIETAPDFMVLENVALSQGSEREQGLNVTVKVATYFRES